jgi:hypothetical protein
VHPAGSTRRESLFNVALGLNEPISEVFFSVRLESLGSLTMVVDKSTEPAYGFYASSFWDIISMARECYSMYRSFLFQERLLIS